MKSCQSKQHAVCFYGLAIRECQSDDLSKSNIYHFMVLKERLHEICSSDT